MLALRRGVYVDAAEWARLAPWERYLTRVHALASVRPASVFARESAAALLGLPLFGEPPRIHVHEPGRNVSAAFGDVVVHTSSDDRQVEEASGIQLLSLHETVVDLTRSLPPAFGLAVADAALMLGADAADLSDRNENRCDGRGRRRAEWVLRNADARAESVGESVSRAVMGWLGFAAPVLQQEFIAEGQRDRADFWWPDVRVVGESDGWAKYGSSDPSGALRTEKRREDRLRRQVAGFARWEWRDAMDAVRLSRILRRAGVPIVRRADHAMLATLTRG